MSLLILGTVALDTFKTPFGEVREALGGSGTYAALAASFFTRPRLLSIIGDDFPQEHLKLLESRGIDLSGLQKARGKTFRWEGYYEFDMNEAHTTRTDLNTFEDFEGEVPGSYRNSEYVFLGAAPPSKQISVIQSLKKPKLIVLDTRDFFIQTVKSDLAKAINMCNILVLNDNEARMLFETPNLIAAGRKGLELGPRHVIIKKGEHGALLFSGDRIFNAPGFPLENVKDPTGCGDCFAGGLTAWLSKTGRASEGNLRKAVVYGSVIASHNAEGLGTERLRSLTIEEIEARFRQMREIRRF